MRNLCDSKGVVKDSENLSEMEIKGRKQIEDGIKMKGWMLYQTDKSGRMCLDTVENYIYCMQEHVVKDTVVTPDMVREGEILINNHARAWTRMAQIGRRNNHSWRVNRALVTNFSTIPPLVGLRKDHKADLQNNKVLGPKLRPLCPANIAPNAPLGNVIGMICRALADKHQVRAKTELISTEELMSSFEYTNKRIR